MEERNDTGSQGPDSTVRRYFIRNLEGPDLFLSFLISAVGAILAIRFYLHMSGYPQLGRGGLHIAHMLWGGLLLLVALMILVGFLDRHAQRMAVMAGGIGWGTFIDELGKFITRDNNYFFAPTVALIYVSFVALYLTFHAIARATTLTDDEYEVNAMRIIEEALVRGLTEDRRARVYEYLARTRGTDPIARAIGDLLRTVDAAPAPPPSPVQRLHAWLRPRYEDLIQRDGFRRTLELFFAGSIVFSVVQGMALAGAALDWADGPTRGIVVASFADLGHLVCSTCSAIFVILGIVSLRHSRTRAYQYFRTSVLITILLTEFFVFLQAQFAALPGFAINLLVLIVLDELIEQERQHTTELAKAAISSSGPRAPAIG